MYVAQHFAMTSEQVREVLHGVQSADLVTVAPSGLVATYLPFVFDPDVADRGALLTHVARNNSQATEPVTGEAMVIVHGTDHYVSPTWMPSQAEHGSVVPTWNYVTVHAYGELIVHDDPAWTEDVVRRVTGKYETRYSVDDVPADYVARMLRAIVGIEVRLTHVEAKAKMSQNKKPDDVTGIVAGLRHEASDSSAMRTAAWMEQVSLPAAQRRAELLTEVARRRQR